MKVRAARTGDAEAVAALMRIRVRTRAFYERLGHATVKSQRVFDKAL